ncbi:crotonase/enoyl-CoA hydratase family protein [Albimonas pacifica]|uniref:Enoyl-CoA hydratase n=1 Tax=Albimonas pacifica TaxID=1114924 RepID=A0A1I3ELU0_9RHOB|nr:crotonase/enoyl-CoA hydratase family protein [Albimonas pacifica]SFH99681.1 enoyl-CoA hydratase [Albimonas pacifica]
MSVVIFKDGPATVVAINRAERRNAVDSAAALALHRAFAEFEADASASVAILTGEGGFFCAGADLKAMAAGDRRRMPVDGPGPMGPTRMRLTKPVIAAIEGPAVAGGLELALWCDLRVMASDAVLGVYCRRFGVPLVDGGTFRLPRLIGHSRAMDLILTGRPVHAEEAVSIGLANRVCAPGEALPTALALAHEIAAFPQVCLRGDRQAAMEQWGLDEAGALAREFEIGMKTVASGESFSGAGRFSEGEGRHGKF